MKVSTINPTYTRQSLNQNNTASNISFSPKIAFKASVDSFISNGINENIKIHDYGNKISGIANKKYFEAESTKKNYEALYGIQTVTIPKSLIETNRGNKSCSCIKGELGEESFVMNIKDDSVKMTEGTIGGKKFSMKYGTRNEITLNSEYNGKFLPLLIYLFVKTTCPNTQPAEEAYYESFTETDRSIWNNVDPEYNIY